MDRLNGTDFPAKHSKSARDDGWAMEASRLGIPQRDTSWVRVSRNAPIGTWSASPVGLWGCGCNG